VRSSRLDERGASKKRIGGYLRRWIGWYQTLATTVLSISPAVFFADLPLLTSDRDNFAILLFHQLHAGSGNPTVD